MSQTTLRTLSCLLRGSSNIEASIWVWLHLPRNSTENRPLPVGIAWLVRNARERATEDWENDPCALVCKKVSQAQWFFSRNILHSNVIWSHSGACLMKAWLGGFDILGSRRRSNKSRANSLVCLLFFLPTIQIHIFIYLQYPKPSNWHSFAPLSRCVEWKFLSANWLLSRCRASKQCGLSSTRSSEISRWWTCSTDFSGKTGAGPWAENPSKIKSVFWQGASQKLIASLLDQDYERTSDFF